jgi:hypothetical protein
VFSEPWGGGPLSEGASWIKREVRPRAMPVSR